MKILSAKNAVAVEAFCSCLQLAVADPVKGIRHLPALLPSTCISSNIMNISIFHDISNIFQIISTLIRPGKMKLALMDLFQSKVKANGVSAINSLSSIGVA